MNSFPVHLYCPKRFHPAHKRHSESSYYWPWIFSKLSFYDAGHYEWTLSFILNSSFLHPHSISHTTISIYLTGPTNVQSLHFTLHIVDLLTVDNFLIFCSKIFSFSENKFPTLSPGTQCSPLSEVLTPFLMETVPFPGYSKTYQSTCPCPGTQHHLCLKIYMHIYLYKT